jgi:hypothetical protein
MPPLPLQIPAPHPASYTIIIILDIWGISQHENKRLKIHRHVGEKNALWLFRDNLKYLKKLFVIRVSDYLIRGTA